MNMLYAGGYRGRFDHITENLMNLTAGTRILELCFGDIYVAEYCKKKGLVWTGIDINNKFVTRARRLGYNAHQSDLVTLDELPKADVCIMAGSLYHFHPHHTFQILEKMVDAADRLIISEPVSNLSSRRGLIGFLAKRAASIGKGNEEFRYNFPLLLATLKEHGSSLDCRVVSVKSIYKDSIIILEKNEKH